jgi:YVTN family beta-propeller protein
MFTRKWFTYVTVILVASVLAFAPGAGNSVTASNGQDKLSAQANPAVSSATDDLGQVAYVTLPDTNQLALVDLTQHVTSNTVDLTQFGCYTPQKVRITPDGNKLYLFCSGSNDLLVIDIETLTMLGKVNNPAWWSNNNDVAFTQDGAYALVSATNDMRIDVIDTTTYTIINSIQVSGYVEEIAVHPYLPLAYAGFGNYSSGGVLVIDTNTFTAKTTIPFGGSTFHVTVSRDGRWIYASDYAGQAGVAVIDTSTNTVVARISGLGELFRVELVPDGSRLFAAGGWQNSIHVINAINRSYESTIGVDGTAWEMGLNCDGSELFVLNNTNTLPVIDTQTLNISYQIELPGRTEAGIAICPQYVAQGMFLSPPAQSSFGKAGETVSYEMQVINATGASDSFDLALLPGNAWPTTLSMSNTGILPDGGSVSFTVSVEIPASASPGSSDNVTIQATSLAGSPASVSTATISTSATSGKNAYVLYEGNNLMSVVDTALHTAIETVDLGTYGCTRPDRAKLTPDATKLYITCLDSASIIVLDIESLALLATIPHQGDYAKIAFTQDGTYALATSGWSSQVDVIDTTTYTIIKSIPTGGFTNSIDVHPYLPRAYVSLAECCYSGKVLVIDTTDFTPVTFIPFGHDITDVKASPDGRWVYVADYAGGQGVGVIDVQTNSIVTTITDVPELFGMAISQDGSRLYAGAGWSNSVYVIDAVNYATITSIGTGGKSFGVELTCDGSELFVADHTDRIPVIDTQNNSISDYIQMPTGEINDIAICPQYVAKGAFLSPPTQSSFGDAGTTVSYSMQFMNLTGASDSFDLTLLPGNNWPTTLSMSNTGALPDGGSVSFTVSVEIPAESSPGSTDNVTIQATSVADPAAFVSTATISTSVFSGKNAYVLYEGNNLMSVVDTVLHTPLETLDLETYGCTNPDHAKLNPDATKLFITCPGSANIIVLDTETNAVLAQIPHPGDRGDIAFTRDGTYALVTSGSSYEVDVIDTSTYTVASTIPTPGPSMRVAVHPYLPLAYVSTIEYDWWWYTGKVLVIDTTNFTVLKSIPFGYSINGISPSPDGKWVFVSDAYYQGSIGVIDVQTNTIVNTIWGLPDAYGSDILPDGSRLYVGAGWSNSVSVIDAVNFQTITSIGTSGNTLNVDLTCDGSQLFAADHTDEIPVIDTQSNTVVTRIQMPAGGIDDIAACPQYVGTGVFLYPDAQAQRGTAGQNVSFQATLINISGSADSFTLSLGDHAWETSLPANTIGPVENGESATITVTVTVPQDAQGDEMDQVVVTATSVNDPGGYSATAEFTTQARYAPVADFWYEPTDPNLYDTIQFYNYSYDPEGMSIESLVWDFGDGASSTDGYTSHRYAADGDYTVNLRVTTADGRTGTISKTVGVRTHDIWISGFEVPTTAKLGQTRDIAVYLINNRYRETVQVDLYKSTPWGYEQVDSRTLDVSVKPSLSTTLVAFKYRFTSDDASYGKVTFKVVVSVLTARDAMPEDNTIIQFPTRVNR